MVRKEGWLTSMGWPEEPIGSIPPSYFVVVKPPSGLLWRPPVAAVPNVAVIVRWALLRRRARQHRQDADTD